MVLEVPEWQVGHNPPSRSKERLMSNKGGAGVATRLVIKVAPGVEVERTVNVLVEEEDIRVDEEEKRLVDELLRSRLDRDDTIVVRMELKVTELVLDGLIMEFLKLELLELGRDALIEEVLWLFDDGEAERFEVNLVRECVPVETQFGPEHSPSSNPREILRSSSGGGLVRVVGEDIGFDVEERH